MIIYCLCNNNNNSYSKYDAFCKMSLPNLSMFDPNDVNNVKADPATFNSNEFVGSLNLTSAQLKTLIDAFETFTDTANYNVNGTALEIEKLQSQFNELHNICTNVCPKCINLATIQTQIATKNVQKKKPRTFV